MNTKRYRQIRVAIMLFLGAMIGFSILQDSYVLASISIFIGLLFLTLVRSTAKITVDEREQTIREKAAQMTYAIFAPTLGIGAFLLLFPSYSGLSVFSKGEFVFLESLGMILAYLALFMIALYALSYHFLNRKFGGDDEK